MNSSKDSAKLTKLLVSFAAIYIIWGTTYLAMRVAVATIPPFLMASGRFFVAGTLLFVILYVRGHKIPTLRQWKSALIVGSFLFVGGNGLVTWSEQEIPSGIAALVIATLPMWMTIFDWLFFSGPRPGKSVWLGLILGFLGIVFLIGPDKVLTGETALDPLSMVALVCAPVFWSIGSLYSRRADLPPSVFMASAAEMMCGSFALLGISLLLGEPFGFNFANVSVESALSWIYLLIFGSIVALSAYAWLLKNAPAPRVATYSYVNPIIAVFLGWLILNEAVSWQTGVAVVLIIAGVVLIVTAPKQAPKKLKAQTDSTGESATPKLEKCPSA